MTRRLSFVALLAAAAALLSCDAFEKDALQRIDGPAPAGARIKFFNFGVNAPAVNFYADDRKMTAVQSGTEQESTNGVAYTGVGAGGYYTAVAPGQYTLSGRIAAATDKDLPISNLPVTLEDGRFYSFYQSGFYNTTAKTVDAFLVEDNFAAQIDFSVAYVRFVHAIGNTSPMTLVARNTTTGDSMFVGGQVAYKAAGAFTALPEGLYDLRTRYAGVTTTAAISRTGVSFVAGRVYSISARGDSTVTSTTATNRPFLDNTANR